MLYPAVQTSSWVQLVKFFYFILWPLSCWHFCLRGVAGLILRNDGFNVFGSRLTPCLKRKLILNYFEVYNFIKRPDIRFYKENLSYFRNFACLQDDPHEREWGPTPIYPGVTYSMDDQCRFDFGQGYKRCTAVSTWHLWSKQYNVFVTSRLFVWMQLSLTRMDIENGQIFYISKNCILFLLRNHKPMESSKC